VPNRTARFHVGAAARRDIATILEWTLREFGMAATERYRLLIRQALLDIASNPDLPGSRERPEIMVNGARTYHIELSRHRVAGPKVKEPRHFILYRRRRDGVILVARVLHDSRDLQRHLPGDFRRGSQR
jgi:toxin ParE1/3/4